MVKVVDDFESGSPSDNYNGNTDTASFVTTPSPRHGSQILEIDPGANFDRNIYSVPGDGLDNYFAKGDAPFTVWVRATGARANVLFGVNSSSPATDRYEVLINVGGNDLLLRKRNSSTTTFLTSGDPGTLATDTWYQVVITWDDGTLGGSDNDITVELKDATDTVLATASDNDADHASESGIGFGGSAAQIDTNDFYFDYAHLATGATITGAATLAGTGTIGASGLVQGPVTGTATLSGTGAISASGGVSTGVTTALPDVGTPTSANPSDSQLDIVISDVTNYGDYRYQLRRAGETGWSSAAEFQEATESSDANTTGTVSHTFTGLNSDQNYEARVRSETEHVNGAWSSTISASTLGSAAARPGTLHEFRIRRPGDSTLDTDLYDVNPLRDAFERFASGATVPLIDTDGTKIDDYPYGTRADVQVSTDGGSTFETRLPGIVLASTRTTRDGLTSVELDIVSYNHLLTRETISAKDYTSTTKTNILKDAIQTFTSVTWVASNVNIQDDTAIDLTVRGETPDEVIARVTSQSANEEWFVNEDLEFVVQSQSSARAESITDDDVIDHDLPTEGKRSVNEFTVYYGSSLSNFWTEEDREAQQELKDKLGTSSGVVISDSDTYPEVDTEDEAREIAKRRIGNQSVLQTGTVTVPLGRFETNAGDVISLTIEDAGIQDVDFRIAQIDYEWTRGKTKLTIAENTAGDIEELLIALSDSLSNTRHRNTDPNATGVRSLPLQSGVSVSLEATLTEKTTSSDAFVFGQSEFGDTLQNGVSSTRDVPIESKKATIVLLNLIRDLWQDGNSSFADLTHLAVGSDDTTATNADDSLQAEISRLGVGVFQAGNDATTFEFAVTVPAGGFFGEQPNLAELSVVDAASGGNHYARITFDSVGIDADTRLKIHLEITIGVDSEEQGVITSKGQERIRDLIIGESNHEPSDMVYGSGTATASESDTALGSKQHEDTIDSTADASPGVAKVVERVTAGDADTTNFSEVGLENAANELLQRIVFEAYGTDETIETTLGMKATNA